MKFSLSNAEKSTRETVNLEWKDCFWMRTLELGRDESMRHEGSLKFGCEILWIWID